MSPSVPNNFRVPAVSSSFHRNGQKFQPEALLKQVSFARLACLYVLVCVCFKTRTWKANIGEGHG